MRDGLIALVLTAGLAGCATTRIESRTTPLGNALELRLPDAPGYPGTLNAVQTVSAQYQDRRATFQAVLELSADRAVVVLTAVAGPRILSIRWTRAGIVEDKTALAPGQLEGVSVLGDIFLSLWPVDAVRAALPPGVAVVEEGRVRRIQSGDRIVVEIETTEDAGGAIKQVLTHNDFRYRMVIVTERDG